MKIQKLCQLTGMTKRTIYHYIKEDLIAPSVNTENGYYDFSEEDYLRLLLIRDYRSAGLSLSVIRTILKNPLTSGYYLNAYMEKLHAQVAQLQNTMDKLDSLLKSLPIFPTLSDLYQLNQQVDLSTLVSTDTKSNFDIYDSNLLNRYLWGPFFQTHELTEYQKYLWDKINLKCLSDTTPDYLLLLKHFNGLVPEYIDISYTSKSRHIEEVSSFTEEECITYAHEYMIPKLRLILKKPPLLFFWKEYYHSFFSPLDRIYSSDITTLVSEMCPIFSTFQHNIHISCKIVYDYLESPQGCKLKEQLYAALGDCLNLNSSCHGELDILTSLDEIYAISSTP